MGINLNIFEQLLQASDPVRSKDIAAKTGAEEALVYRILRFLAAHRFIDEVDVDQFKANKTTKALTIPKASAGFDFM
jgi:demethylsterigmatocystin 6-O-methyltransferase